MFTMCRFLAYSLVAVALLFFGEKACAQDLATAYKTKIQPFLKAHCSECHGPEVKKAGLRLDNLNPDFGDPRTMATWVKAHDKLVAGEMPPKKSERPPQRDLDMVTQLLHKELHSASLEKQQKEGRVVLRRLNMFSLILVGVAAAFSYSLVALGLNLSSGGQAAGTAVLWLEGGRLCAAGA